MANTTGKKFGGRQAGTKNKDRTKLEAAAKAKGITPLEYMLEVLINKDKSHDPEARMDAAKAAAPYIHRKMPLAIEAEVKADLNVFLLKGDDEL